MHLKAPCPSCGKRARYSEAEAGLPGVCHACGTRFTLPSVAAPVATDDIPLAVPVPQSRLMTSAWVWAALAGGIVIGLCVGVAAVVMMSRSFNPTPVAPLASSSNSANSPVASTPHTPTPPAVPAVPLTGEDHSEPTVTAQPTAPVSPSANSESPGSSASITPPVHPSFIPDGGPIHATPQTSNPKPPAKTPSTDTSGRPPIHPIAENADTLTDARIGQAITDGVNFLLSHFDGNTHELKQNRVEFQPLGPARADSGAFYGGLDALEVYALLQSGQAINDNRLGIKSPYMIGMIEQLKKMSDKLGPVTYARALRATALTLFNRPEDKTVIKSDLEWLLKASQSGAYTYDKIDTSMEGPGRYMPRGMTTWDASNSQYGLLGVWSAAEAGFEVPLSYWKQVEDHWTKNQMASGEWGYETPAAGAGRLSMTVAGIASLFVTHDYLIAPRFGNEVGRDPFSPALVKGLDWLEASNHSVDTSTSEWWGYTLYGLERVGLASGFKYFGTHDWYRELARQIIDAQNPDGSWGRQELIDTPYALLFLARGRHPIIMNKLRFDGFWANRPRDLANFSRYASDEMETPVNWQVIPIDHDWTDWTDCPVLYMASHKAPTLTDANYDNIRSFIQSGGLLFTQADGGDPEFDRFVGVMAKKLFPNYPLTALSPDHPLFSSLFHMQIKPSLKAVSNGARLLMVHSSVDLARAWQLREQKVNKMPFEFGLNLFLYASGKHQLRNRLETNYITAPSEAPTYTINVARVRYGSDRDHAGNWDPEPYAWTRFSRWFQRQTGYGVDAKEIDMSDLTLPAAPIAILTGTDAYEPEKAEIQAVRKYVEAGGVLFVDSAGGTGALEESVRTKLFARAFPNGFLRLLPSDHPLLNSGNPGMEDLSHPRLRPFALEKLGSPANEFPSSFTAGRGHVIFTPLDMTCGLLGTNTWGILGYEPGYSQSFIKNLLLWTVDGQKDD
jgi:hypothetical protein